MTGCRKSDQDLYISLPDFNKSDVKRVVDLVCSGECFIEKAAQYHTLTELCKILRLDSLSSFLEYSKEKIDEETQFASNDPDTGYPTSKWFFQVTICYFDSFCHKVESN